MKPKEQHIYGSSRLGMKNCDCEIIGAQAVSDVGTFALVRGEKSYELSNHLGNVLEVITDQKLAISDGGSGIDHFLAEVISYTDYYPFGAPMDNGSASSDRNWQGDYRYGFNGMEHEPLVNTGEYDFGARMYDGRLGRWLSVDENFKDYIPFSTYSFVKNLPIRAIDPDGKKILFVNGYWCSGFCGYIVGATEPGEPYWGDNFAIAAQNFFSDYSIIDKDNFIDGSSQFGGDQDGEDRFNRGRGYAKSHLAELTSDLVEGETIKIVTHSEGAAMGSGIADYLIEQGFNVEFVVHLSADEPADFETPSSPMTFQIAYCDDPVTVESIIKGVDKQGIIYDADLPIKYQHGQTGNADIFKKLSDLKSASIDQTLTYCKSIDQTKIVYTQNMDSTPNGTEFSEINGRELYNPDTCEPIDK